MFLRFGEGFSLGHSSQKQLPSHCRRSRQLPRENQSHGQQLDVPGDRRSLQPTRASFPSPTAGVASIAGSGGTEAGAPS